MRKKRQARAHSAEISGVIHEVVAFLHLNLWKLRISRHKPHLAVVSANALDGIFPVEFAHGYLRVQRISIALVHDDDVTRIDALLEEPSLIPLCINYRCYIAWHTKRIELAVSLRPFPPLTSSTTLFLYFLIVHNIPISHGVSEYYEMCNTNIKERFRAHPISPNTGVDGSHDC